MADNARLEMKLHELNDKLRAVLLRVETLQAYYEKLEKQLLGDNK